MDERLHSAIGALLDARSIQELERILLEILPGAAGFERVAILSLPTLQQPSRVLQALGYPRLELREVARGSPLAAGSPLDTQRSGAEGDAGVPHGNVRGRYVLAPIRERERIVALLYADSLRDDADPAGAAAAVAFVLDVARIVRANVSLSTERERLLSELDSLARLDALTQLPNRRVFDERLEQELHRSARTRRPFGLAIFDLDNFTAINASYGRHAGDEALQQFAAALRSRARHVDFVARFADDEIVMLLVEADRLSAKAIVERVLDAVRQVKLSVPVGLSASAGVALSYPVDTAETLLERAAAALYDAKQLGRDRAKTT